MRENKGFVIACCLLWISVLAIGCFGDSDTGFLLTLFVLPVSIISWLVLCVLAIVKLFSQDYLPSPKRLVPLYFTVAPVILWFTTGMIVQAIRDESTWLVITRYDFHGSANFRFAKNGEYTSWRDSPLSRSSEGNGRYERRDSILLLHPQLEDGKQREVKLAIRPYSELKKHRSSRIITLVTLDTTVRHY